MDAIADLSMFGLVIMAGAALSWLSALYPAEMPVWGPWQFSWVEYIGCVFALGWYVRGILRMAPEPRPALWRQIFYYLGVASIYAVIQTRLTYLAQHLFTATQAQQFVLHDIGPFLIALSWPGAVLREGMPPSLRRRLHMPPVLRLLRAVQQPVIAALLFISLLVGQALPVVVFRMMLDRRVFDIMNVLMVVDGVLFWCLVLDPRPQPPAG
ncbi:MAG TPA: cytochrome c oxidase assembly protein, partial [Rhizomicrobium sp.]|nr:cytochrome c oxidase assembly protein [Rhizomicrobium sp.]